MPLPTLATLDDGAQGSTAIALGRDGLPVIAWSVTGEGVVHLSRCLDVLCVTAVTTNAAATDTSGGARLALAMGTDGLPIMSHGATGGTGLQVTHCGNVFCTPYARNR